jgi:ankyrin repeat protein
MTPLHYTCRNGFLDIANLLLELGAEIEATTLVRQLPSFCIHDVE